MTASYSMFEEEIILLLKFQFMFAWLVALLGIVACRTASRSVCNNTETSFHLLPPSYAFVSDGSHVASWPYCSLT
jgi:hypothetical protein